MKQLHEMARKLNQEMNTRINDISSYFWREFSNMQRKQALHAKSVNIPSQSYSANQREHSNVRKEKPDNEEKTNTFRNLRNFNGENYVSSSFDNGNENQPL